MTAELAVLTAGYANDRVASTVTLIVDGDAVIVVDPGMVSDRAVILDPLRERGIDPRDVTDVVLSHHHPDHTINVALFPVARVHDFQAVYLGDVWEDAEAERSLSTDVRLLATPGHTPQDISTAVTTVNGLIVCTHLWWHSDGPADDPFSPDRSVLVEQRHRVLDLNPTLIVPGHGPAFAPDADTPL